VKLYLRENIQFIFICLIWVFVGFFFGPVNLVLVPLSILLLYHKNFEVELLVGFILVLTLSDSRSPGMLWAGQVKNIYILILSLIMFKKYSELKIKINLHLFIAPFICVAIFCLVFSPIISVAFQKTLSYFLLIFIVPNYFSYLFDKYGENALKQIVYAILLVLIIGLIVNFVFPDFTNLIGRYRGLLGNPNGLGIYCFLFICFFTIVIEFYPDLFSKNEVVLIYLIGFASLFMCGARSSLIGVVIFLSFRYFNKLSPILSFMILILVIALYEYISSNIENIVFALGVEKYFRVETLKDGSGRLVAWQFAWENINKNVFLGKGFSYTEKIYKDNYQYLSMLGHQGAAHNAYLTFWLDTGLIGLVSFIVGLFSFIIHISMVSRSLFPLFFAALFSNQFESWLTASLNPFTILFLLSLSLIFIEGKRRESNTENNFVVTEDYEKLNSNAV